MKRVATDEQIEEMVRLYRTGNYTQIECCKMVGLKESSGVRWLNKALGPSEKRIKLKDPKLVCEKCKWYNPHIKCCECYAFTGKHLERTRESCNSFEEGEKVIDNYSRAFRIMPRKVSEAALYSTAILDDYDEED